MASTKYADLVREGKTAKQNVEQGQWLLGDLALQVCPPDGTNPHNHSLREYADAIGINLGTLQNYRTTAEAWPLLSRRSDTSFAAHQALASNPEREKKIKPGMTQREAINIGRKERGLLPLTKDPDEVEILITADAPTREPIRLIRPPFHKPGRPSETPEERLERLTDELQEAQAERDDLMGTAAKLSQPNTPEGNAARKAEGLFSKTEWAGAAKGEANSAFEAGRALVEKHRLVIRVSVEGGE